ncbi:ShlB/FhaC/HecB family hemolysin secretion/activation protein [Moraxella bovoculi]|uniref:ShlB/FhaC/HecB family hemolysin secretion/activation protein n=1 Tax=Moraxella bovoculi TaxID=386891 RepID=UPI003F50A277
MHPSIPRIQTLLLFMLCMYCKATYANTQSTTTGSILLPKTLSSELRQAELTHLARQDFEPNFDFGGIDVVDDTSDADMVDVSSPTWLDEAADTPCFVIDEIGLQVDDGLRTDNRFDFVLYPLLDYNKPTFAIGRCIGQQNLSLIVNIAHNELLKRGFLTSHIGVDEQDLSSGRLVLTVNTGKIKNIAFQSNKHHKAPIFIRQALATKPNQVFHLPTLEHGIDTLKKIDPTANLQIMPSELDGYSDLLVTMDRTKSIHLGFHVDNSLSDAYDNYLASIDVRANNLLGVNDEWQVSANYPLFRLIDAMQDDLGVKLDRDRQLNYHTSLTLPYGLYKANLSHSHYQYKQFIEGLDNPLMYHGTTKTSSLGLTRLLHRNATHKTEGYIKAHHKQSRNFIDDVQIEVQNRRTTGYGIGITYQQYFSNNAYLYTNLEYRQGTGALKAKPAPEEDIYNAFGQRLPSEGFARAPIWSVFASFQKPIVLNQNSFTQNTKAKNPIHLNYTAKLQAQYARQLPTPSDLFYLGGYDTRGIKEGDYLSGEHGVRLSQELAWHLPYQSSNNQHSTQLYIGLDQGMVYGQNTIKNQRYLSAAAIGIRHHYQTKEQAKQSTHNQSNFKLNNTPNTAYIDLFIGKAIKAPEWIKDDWVIGVGAGIGF